MTTVPPRSPSDVSDAQVSLSKATTPDERAAILARFFDFDFQTEMQLRQILSYKPSAAPYFR